MAKTPGFKDHFSGQANQYARYRPGYPDALFEWLASVTPARDTAWDCATGSGQAADALSTYFSRVFATDASQQQIKNAIYHLRVEYYCVPAEKSGFSDHSIDLITVAQALHWFDIPAFFEEARRVLRNGGVLAYWCYGLANINDTVDKLVMTLYGEILGDAYWPSERRMIEEGYVSIEAPFERLASPNFVMETDWNLAQLLGYLRTWSATNRYLTDKGEDPVFLIEEELGEIWGEPEVSQRVSWPLSLTAGVNKALI